MSNPYMGAIAAFDAERSVTAPFAGVSQNLGTVLSYPAVIAIFDNQSDVAVAVSINGVTWKTFAVGEALVLDLRANHGNAPTLVIPANSQFTILGAAGTGSFRLSIIYAR